MKWMMIIGLMLTILSVSAHEIVVSRMNRETGYTDRFSLKSNFPRAVLLDCQSFIQGLFLGPQDTDEVIMLQEWECDELKADMKKSLQRFKKHCIEVDLDNSEMVSQATCQ